MAIQTVLFVCTGNIFRSMTAEHAFRAQIGQAPFWAASAGTEGKFQPMFPPVRARLVALGIDPSAHVQRKLTQEMLDGADLAVAMGEDHQAFIREHFGCDVPLFNRVALGKDEPVLDIGEVAQTWRLQENWQEQYAVHVVDAIWRTMPGFIENMGRFIKE